MSSRRLEDFSPEEQRDIQTAFRLGRSLTRRLIITLLLMLRCGVH
jgi:hypothetical protein